MPGSQPVPTFVEPVPPPPNGTPRSWASDWFEVQAEAEAPELPGFEIEAPLGRGGMGLVYSAWDLKLKRRVAVKLPRWAGAADGVERLRREAELLARLQHPHIVAIHEIGMAQGAPFIVQEFLAEGSLADALAGKPQPPRAAAELLATLAEAVQFAHAHGLVHRDLKWANVLWRRRDETPAAAGRPFRLEDVWPKIADFGLAKELAADGQASPTRQIVGTPAFMAPEQARSGAAACAPAVDLYALGAMLYELLTGRPPFVGVEPLEILRQTAEEEPVPPHRLAPGVPADLETICLKCIEKAPERRYASAGALAAELRRFLAGEPVAARPPGPWERSWRWMRRHPTGAVAAGLLAAVGLLALGGLLEHQRRLGAALARAEAGERQAEQNYASAKATLERMLRELDHSRKDVPGVADLKRRQQEAALAYFEAQARSSGADPKRKADAATAAFETARLQLQLGRDSDAEANAARAVALFAELAAEEPTQLNWLEKQAGALANLSYARQGKPQRPGAPPAAELAAQSVALRRRLVTLHPENPGYRRGLAGALHAVATFDYAAKRREAAIAHWREAAALKRALLAQPDAEPEDIASLAKTLTNLGILLQSQESTCEEAMRCSAEAQDLYLKRLKADPADHDAAADLAALRVNVAYVLRKRKRHDEAIAAMAESARDLDERLSKEPNLAALRRAAQRCHGMLAETLDEAGRLPEGLVHLRRQSELLGGKDLIAEHFLLLGRARAGDHVGLLADLKAHAQTKLPADDVLYLPNLAATCAQAAQNAAQAAAWPESQRPVLAAAYRKLGCDLLERTAQRRRQAGAAAFRDFVQDLEAAPEFAPLRTDPAFAPLLASLRSEASSVPMSAK